MHQVRLVRCKKLKKGEASQKCISLISSLFELLRFWASEDREHFEALRTFQARWARSENHCVLQCFDKFRGPEDQKVLKNKQDLQNFMNL